MSEGPLPADLPVPLVGGPDAILTPPPPEDSFAFFPSERPRNPFTYPAWDLLTLNPLDPLPYTNVSFGREINQAGPWAGQLLLTDRRIQKLDYLAAMNVGSAALFVDYLGTLIWGGVLWTKRYDAQTKTASITAQEFGSYWGQRLQAKDYSEIWEGEGKAVDPLIICETIFNDAQHRAPEVDVAPAEILGGITVVVSRDEPGAPPINASYPGTQLQTVDSIIQTLSQMGYKQGFDYSYDCEYLPGTQIPAIVLHFYFPRQGREAAESGLVVLGSDCENWKWDEDSTKQADLVRATGSGSGGLQPAQASAAPSGYPLLEKAVSHTQINNEGVLAAVAFGELGQTVWPVTTPQLILPINPPDEEGNLDPNQITFGDFQLGDDLEFRLDPVAGGGRNTDPRFPHGVSFEWRITNWTCTPADKGITKLTFNLTTPPVEKGVLPPQPPLT